MSHGFTWFSSLPIFNLFPEHVLTALLVSVLLVGLALLGRQQLESAPDPAIPEKTLSARNLIELFLEFFEGLATNIIGEDGRRYVPLYGCFFLFILANNLMGLIPGFSPATANFNTSLALGLTSFILYNVFAFQKHGIGYLKHFLGPVAWLAPLFVVLEIVDHFVRPVTLALRLTGNMTGDHMVLSIFTDLTYVIIPVIFYAMGTFVCFVQAFVFTLLSMVYVSMATAGHDDHHDEAHESH